MLLYRRKSYRSRWPMQGRGEHLWATLLGHFNENLGSFRRQVGTLSEHQRQELSVNTRSSTLSALTSKSVEPQPCLHFPFKA